MSNSSAPTPIANNGINKKKAWWKSLQVKIIAWSFVPTVIILAAVAGITFYSYQKVLGDLAIKQDRDIVQTNIGQYWGLVTQFIDATLTPIFMNTDRPSETSLEVRTQNILDNTPNLDIFDGGIYFLDGQGKIIKTRPEQPELIGQDWPDFRQLNYIKAHPNVGAITDLLSFGSSGKKIFCVALAMSAPTGELVGAGYYCIQIYPVTQNAYYQKISSLDYGSSFYVIDSSLQVIYAQDRTEIGGEISGKAYIHQLLEKSNPSGRFRIGGKEVVVSYVRISNETDSLGWLAVNERSLSEIMQPTLAYRQLLLVLLALGVIVPVLVTAYGVRHITHPIQKLIQATEQVTAGQFKQRIEVKTGDEIETLADQFNLMSAELEDSYSSLEKKVADRTRELAVINAILSVANRSLDIYEILDDSLKITVEQLGFRAGAAFKLEPDGTEPLLVTTRGFEATITQDLAKTGLIEGQTNTTDHPSQVTALEISNLQDEKLSVALAQAGFQMLVYVPLSSKGRTLGLFILGEYKLHPLSPEELALLSSLGQQIGVAIENAHLYEQAEKTAIAVERNRLARELHDAVTQTLFSASLIADVTPRIWKRNPEEGLQNLEELRQLTRGALAEMRTLLLEMRPESLERADLKSLITQLTDAFVGRVRIPIDLQINGDCVLTHEVKLVFYRVAQEALNNIAKHSGARQVEVRLACGSGEMNLSIKDDGLGFEAGSITPDHLGIAIMRERANSVGASFKIESQPGQGTTVELGWKAAGKD